MMMINYCAVFTDVARILSEMKYFLSRWDIECIILNYCYIL